MKNLVEELNSALFSKREEEYCFSYKTNGYIESISFMGVELWNSENEDRNFSEKDNEYEDLGIHIMREFNKHVERLSKIKFKRVPKWKNEEE